MEMIAIILSGLALLAAITVFVLFVQEKKRNEKQRADSLVEKAKGYEEELRYKAAISQEMDKLVTRICNLEKGIVPDFEEAKAAANAVNDFNRGLSNILGFDPLEEAKKAREKAMYGGEVE